ncbi:uncharacterized protein Z520_09905 [Fonsecaea multimorphosa CBS 102226]|uniref:F-box domain-containing protein n=1 Tax=Fonsecaea multimorphosa CBS 102226 TaxID=1442371 RepID=A0A0D2JVI6_9EURO|nr:uncharacterized protein Z520_09905 [Fonsecaea multimorphosa CBS 102226]KIX94519.1 hypothetical protein Z520_09905 [Fonsecaea multimorphosa CBS 102226]OAL20096.1 hypothetical protein AYO22_09246 [Fonsecaea multimorphosa]
MSTNIWYTLPFELQQDILCRLGRDDLKSVRQINRYSNGIATPVLYNTVHISPNTQSFGRALRIARRKRFAAHVRHIVYHVGLIESDYTREEFFNEVTTKAFVASHLSSQNLDQESLTTEKMYQCYLEETAAQEAFYDLDEFQELFRLTRRFTRLTSIATIRDEYDPFSPPQGYIESRTGLPAAGFHKGCAFVSLFEATAQSHLTTVHGDDLPWGTFLRLNALPSTPLRLERLRALHLGLYKSSLHPDPYHDPMVVLPALRRFLRLCGNLGMLSLDFDELPVDRTYQFLECISREALYKCHFPRLSCLKLRGLMTLEEPFIRFLQSHSNTLRALELADLMIVRSRSMDDDDFVPVVSTLDLNDDHTWQQASIVSAFQKIHNFCKLDRVQLGGNFTNTYDEAWYVTKIVQEGIVSRIQHFLCRQGPSPFPPLARYLRMQEISVAKSRVALQEDDSLELEPAAKQFCDKTWEWCPELLDEWSPVLLHLE